MSELRSLNTEEAIEEVAAGRQANRDGRKLSIEALSLAVSTAGVHRAEDQMAKEFVEVRQRQEKILALHQLQRQINADSQEGEGFDWTDSPEKQALIEKARELGVAIPNEDFVYDEADQRALTENIRLTVDELQSLNSVQMQKITNLTNRRYEFYQMARSIMRPLHDAKTNMARKTSGH